MEQEVIASKKVKWLIYTVLVGLIPILSRFIVWLVTQQGTVDLFNGGDFVAFGLVLHISNINEIEHVGSPERAWKTVQTGVSIVFIAFYGVLFTLALLASSPPSVVDLKITKYSVMVLSAVSLIISYSVYDRVSKVSEAA